MRSEMRLSEELIISIQDPEGIPVGADSLCALNTERQGRLMVKREGAGASLPGFKAWLCHLLAMKF